MRYRPRPDHCRNTGLSRKAALEDRQLTQVARGDDRAGVGGGDEDEGRAPAGADLPRDQLGVEPGTIMGRKLRGTRGAGLDPQRRHGEEQQQRRDRDRDRRRTAQCRRQGSVQQPMAAGTAAADAPAVDAGAEQDEERRNELVRNQDADRGDEDRRATAVAERAGRRPRARACSPPDPGAGRGSAPAPGVRSPARDRAGSRRAPTRRSGDSAGRLPPPTGVPGSRARSG